MSIGQGSTKDLSRGSQEAFQALINSIAPETAAATQKGKLTPEAVEKLSQKLKEIVGEDAANEFEHHRNERGELVNEEGLPITEINEPVQDVEAKGSETVHINDDRPLINLASLPSVAKDKLRQQRDRILDMLEEEERQEEERQVRVDREEREEILRKRKEEALNEKERLAKAKELQKKMGQALLRNMGHSGKATGNSTQGEGTSKPRVGSELNISSEERKKTVTFAEEENSDSTGKTDCGDVIMAKLRSGQRPTLLQRFLPNNSPVKLNVTERKAAGSSTVLPSSSPASAQQTRDSDDESESEDNKQVDQHSDSDESDKVFTEEPPDSEEDDGEVELENEYDLDYAQHQREIALEYYQKRDAIGQDAAKAMMGQTYEEEEETTPDISTPNNQAKPSISRFKANRMASAYGVSARAESKSLADSALPGSSVQTLRSAIRTGRIDDDDRLTGGENDSDSENEADGLQEALELLKKGEVYNLGPDGKYLYGVSPPKPGTAAATSSSVAPPSSSTHLLPPLNRPQITKFKVDRTQAGRPSTPQSTASTPPTPISHLERSSPKLPIPVTDTVVEKKPAGTLEARTHASPTPGTSMIVESPSFRAPRPTYPQTKTSAQPFTSVIIESPSFPKQPIGSLQTPSTGAPPIITVDSPTFPPPGQQHPSRRRPDRPPEVAPSQSLSTSSTSKPIAQKHMPPTSTPDILPPQGQPVITSTVRERATPLSNKDQVPDIGAVPRKVSKFKQERNG